MRRFAQTDASAPFRGARLADEAVFSGVSGVLTSLAGVSSTLAFPCARTDIRAPRPTFPDISGQEPSGA